MTHVNPRALLLIALTTAVGACFGSALIGVTVGLGIVAFASLVL